jgi:glycosyltransferase involved in cell wall biosynthesis
LTQKSLFLILILLQKIMKISILIPTYNRPDFLAEALASVWEQTILPDEIIIGDDSKNNITEELIKSELSPKSPVPIHYFHHYPSLRQARNVDFLINSASCDLLMLLHDDDLLTPNCLELLIKPLKDFPEVVCSFGDQIFIEENGELKRDSNKINKRYYRSPERAGLVMGEWASAVQMFPNDAFLVRSEAAKSIGYYGNGRGGDAVDFYFGFRLGKGNTFYYVNQFTAKYRICNQSVTGSGSLEFMSSTLKILLEELDKEKLQLPEVKKKIKQLMNPAISEVIRAGDRRTAINWMLSPYYNLFTLKGFKRVFMLANPF